MTKDDIFMLLPPGLLLLFQIGKVLLDAVFNVLWVLW